MTTMHQCSACAETSAENARLRAELEAARKLSGQLSDVVAKTPSMGPNTAMIPGAALSGGDTEAMARRLAGEPEAQPKKARPRIQYEVTKEGLEKIDLMVEQAGLESRHDLIEEALTLYAWAVEQTAAGADVISRDPKDASHVTKFLTKGLGFVERRRKTT